jgi:hypothetical protein
MNLKEPNCMYEKPPDYSGTAAHPFKEQRVGHPFS